MRQAAQLDEVFHALADSTRRGMLALLAETDRTAGELGQPFAISQPAASKHIGILERAGLVSRQVEGRQHRFRLRPDPLRDSEEWIARHRRLWEGSLAQLDGVLARMQQRPGKDKGNRR